MSNDVVKPPNGLGLRYPVPASYGLPDLPPELVRALGMTVGEASDRYLPRPGDVSIAMAVEVLADYGAAYLPAAPGLIEGWMDRVALAVANPPDAGGRKAAMAAIIALSGDLPRMCWTLETWQAFLRRGPDAKFWPAAAEVDGFLRSVGDRHYATLRLLRRIAAVGSQARANPATAPEPVSDAASMTLAERDAAIAAIRAKHGLPRSGAANDDDGPASTVPPVRAVPVDVATLQAIRDRRRAALGLAPLPPISPKGA